MKRKYLNGNPDAEGSAAYVYDLTFRGKGKLSWIGNLKHNTHFAYDQYGRKINQTENILGINYTTLYDYNFEGKLATLTYPGGYEVNYTYNSQGELRTVKDPTGNTLWRLAGKNRYGQPCKCA